MVRIAPINLNFNPKTLWFDAGDFDVRSGDGVVVDTARGTEFGRAAGDVFEADAAQVKKLKTPLKPVRRLATEDDEEQAAEMERASAEALPVFKRMVAEANSDMHPVSVEYLFDGDKAIFYFEAEERVDFRDLVRKLAAHFHVRIDMRQIGVRDEARMVGGLGHCGQELCCKRLGGEFCPVSIRMAKEQDLSLNPQKISGVCGRLMCCLRYEFDAYKDFKSRAPKQNSHVETPLGTAKVIDLDVPREIVSLKVDGEKPVKVPLADFDPPQEGNRPKSVSREAWEDATAEVPADGAIESSIFATSQLTGQDKLADPTAVRRTGRTGQKPRGNSGAGGSGAKQGSRNGARNGSDQPAATPVASSRKPRKRRSTKVGGASSPDGAVAQKSRAGQVGSQQKSQSATGQPKNQTSSSQKKKQRGAGGQKGQQGSRSGDARSNQSNQNRQNGSGSQNGQNRQNGQGGQKKQGGQASQDARRSQGPRPGQKSSGLRQKPASQSPSQSKQGASARPERGEGGQTGEGGYRRARRRSHRSGGEAAGGEGARPNGEN